MKTRMTRIATLLAIASLLAMPVVMGHGNKPGTASAKIGGGEIKVDFVGPAAQGRDVLGLIQPGSYWRMGADRATTLTTDVPIEIGGTTVPAGSYKLVAQFTDDKNWYLVVAEDLGSGFKPTKVVAKAAGNVIKREEVVENMTIKLETNGSKGKFVLDWGTARLTADFSAA